MSYYDHFAERETTDNISITPQMAYYLAEELFGRECEDCYQFLAQSTTVEEVKQKFATLMSVMHLSNPNEQDDIAKFKSFVFGYKLFDLARFVIANKISHEVACFPTKRTSISDAVREDVLSAGKCAYCSSGANLQVDHIVPLAKGGSNNRANLQALCESCNKSKNSKYEAEIIRALREEIFKLKYD